MGGTPLCWKAPHKYLNVIIEKENDIEDDIYNHRRLLQAYTVNGHINDFVEIINTDFIQSLQLNFVCLIQIYPVVLYYYICMCQIQYIVLFIYFNLQLSPQ